MSSRFTMHFCHFINPSEFVLWGFVLWGGIHHLEAFSWTCSKAPAIHWRNYSPYAADQCELNGFKNSCGGNARKNRRYIVKLFSQLFNCFGNCFVHFRNFLEYKKKLLTIVAKLLRISRTFWNNSCKQCSLLKTFFTKLFASIEASLAVLFELLFSETWTFWRLGRRHKFTC